MKQKNIVQRENGILAIGFSLIFTIFLKYNHRERINFLECLPLKQFTKNTQKGVYQTQWNHHKELGPNDSTVSVSATRRAGDDAHYLLYVVVVYVIPLERFYSCTSHADLHDCLHRHYVQFTQFMALARLLHVNLMIRLSVALPLNKDKGFSA